MKALQKLNKASDLLKLNFKGIEVVETKEGSGGTDFKGIEFRDTITGTSIRIEIGSYSELICFVEKPKQYKDRYTVKGKLDGVESVFGFETREEAEQFVLKFNIADSVIDKIKEEVVE